MGVKDKFCNSKIKGVFCMYKGDYDKEVIFLTKELDRKRIENEKCEVVLYQADYKFIDRNDDDIRETRVVKFIPDNGEVYHGILTGIRAREDDVPNKLDYISHPLTTSDFFASSYFWCAEFENKNGTDITEELEQTPCEIWLGNRDIDGSLLIPFQKKLRLPIRHL